MGIQAWNLKKGTQEFKALKKMQNTDPRNNKEEWLGCVYLRLGIGEILPIEKEIQTRSCSVGSWLAGVTLDLGFPGRLEVTAEGSPFSLYVYFWRRRPVILLNRNQTELQQHFKWWIKFIAT